MMYTPKAQDIYRHFKGKLYQIVTIAEHTETEEKLVIYQALYGEFKIYARPLSMFLEKVDKQKYPDATQEYRFEKVERETLLLQTQEEQAIAEEKMVQIEESSMQVAEVQILQTGQKSKEPKVEPQVKQCAESESEQCVEEEVPELDPLLLEFLDAETYTQKLDILSALHHRITDSMITTMAIAGDIEVAEGDLETRYNELKNCLRMLERYEIERVR